MNNSNLVEVRIGGQRYGGWKSVRIEAGIEQIARAFVLEVTEKCPGKTDYRAFHTGFGTSLCCMRLVYASVTRSS